MRPIVVPVVGVDVNQNTKPHTNTRTRLRSVPKNEEMQGESIKHGISPFRVSRPQTLRQQSTIFDFDKKNLKVRSLLFLHPIHHFKQKQLTHPQSPPTKRTTSPFYHSITPPNTPLSATQPNHNNAIHNHLRRHHGPLRRRYLRHHGNHRFYRA